jgi:3-oxoacyl-[acyl-carrier-protein] synthase II
MKRVVITGMGAMTPIGNNVNDYWNNLNKGVSGAGPITRFDASKFKTRFACEVKGFDPLNYLEKSEVRKYDLYTQYSIAASEQAIKQADINFDKVKKDRIGVIWGSVMVACKLSRRGWWNLHKEKARQDLILFLCPRCFQILHRV